MKKVINSPVECKHRGPIEDYHKCTHPKAYDLTYCNDPNKFPHQCPLDDAPVLNMMQMKALLRKYLFEIMTNSLINMIYGLGGNSNAKVIGCRFYQEGRENPCVGGRFPNWAGACAGITCGHFEPK